MLKRGITYLNENECPKCSGKLVLISVEKSLTLIDKDGIPIISNNIDDIVDINLVCQDCSKVYEVEKRGIFENLPICYGEKRCAFVASQTQTRVSA